MTPPELIRAGLENARRIPVSQYLEFPRQDSMHHTMGDSLQGYVAQRVPESALFRAVKAGFDIEIHGIPAEVFVAHRAVLGFGEGTLEELDLAYNHWPRARCSRRPSYFLCSAQRKVVVAVISGGDYVRHYAALLRHFLGGDEPLTVVEYPWMEAELCAWTGFDDVVEEGDVLFYGYAADFLAFLKPRTRSLKPLGTFENGYYYTERFQWGERTLNFYECKHHGWGSISALAMRRAAELGAQDVFYISKGATCEGPEHIYETIYCPTRYVVTRYTEVLERSKSTLRNPLVTSFPELDTGWHLSLPTVMEEDYAFRAVLTQSGARSLDNEAAQIALAIEHFNTTSGNSDVGFTAIQFPTDYIRHRDEAEMRVEFDLENNRRAPAEARRRVIKKRIFEILERHLLEST